jgi:hypothetical protein
MGNLALVATMVPILVVLMVPMLMRWRRSGEGRNEL